jgi:hypothetical protein
VSDQDSEPPDMNLVDLLDEAGEALLKCTLALVRSHLGRPKHVGTGFLLRSGEPTYLVSAANVLDEGEDLSYYIAPNEVTPLLGSRTRNRFDGDRDHDPIDVGIVRLGSAIPSDKVPIDMTFVRPHLLPREGRIYSVIGFRERRIEPILSTRRCAARCMCSERVQSPMRIIRPLDTQQRLIWCCTWIGKMELTQRVKHGTFPNRKASVERPFLRSGISLTFRPPAVFSLSE